MSAQKQPRSWQSVVALAALGCSTWSCGGGGQATATGGAGTTVGAGGTMGGNTGSGGGANAMPPPHMVGNCGQLGAVDQFEDITPPGVLGQEYGVTNVVADPVHSGTVYVGTDHKGLFKTTDCGSTWTHVNTGRNGSILDSGLNWSLVIDYIDPNVLYTSAAYGSELSLMKSTNGGVDWDSTAPMGSLIATTVQYNFLQDTAIDPTDHLHLVITFHGNCMTDLGAGCIAETHDGAATWTLLKGPTSGWQDGSGPQIFAGSKFLVQTVLNGLFYTEDAGNTYEMVAQGADHSLYKAVDGSFYSGSEYGLIHSTDGGHHWTVVPGAPKGYGIIGDGKRMFLSMRYADQPYFTSPETDGMTWTPLPSPSSCCGGVYLAYDSDHHVLYSANTRGGLLRVVTQ